MVLFYELNVSFLHPKLFKYAAPNIICTSCVYIRVPEIGLCQAQSVCTRTEFAVDQPHVFRSRLVFEVLLLVEQKYRRLVSNNTTAARVAITGTARRRIDPTS